jgi:hypothetical protein
LEPIAAARSAMEAEVGVGEHKISYISHEKRLQKPSRVLEFNESVTSRVDPTCQTSFSEALKLTNAAARMHCSLHFPSLVFARPRLST